MTYTVLDSYLRYLKNKKGLWVCFWQQVAQVAPILLPHSLRWAPRAKQCFGWHSRLCCHAVSIYFIFYQLDLFLDQVHCTAVQTLAAANARAGKNLPGGGRCPNCLSCGCWWINVLSTTACVGSLSIPPSQRTSIWFLLLSNVFYSHTTFARSTAIPNLQLWNWTATTISKISFRQT